jgi:hypothetical protein
MSGPTTDDEGPWSVECLLNSDEEDDPDMPDNKMTVIFPETVKSVPQTPPVLRGWHVLRNYLKNKAFCAIQVYANVLATHYTTIAHSYTPSSIANP